MLCSWLIFTIAAMGLNLTLGYAGQISLAQASFMAIGAYTTALLTLAGMHWLLAMPVAVVVCFRRRPGARLSGAARAGAFPGLRDAGLQHAGVPGAAQRGLADGRHLRPVGHAAAGFLASSTPPSSCRSTISPCVVFVIAALLMWGIVRSPWGRAFRALRENPVRAESLGVDTRRITLLAFAIGSAYGGLAGALMTPLVQFIEPGSFALIHSLRILLMVVVGGAGFFFGPMLGAARGDPAARGAALHRGLLPDASMPPW